VTAKGPDLDLEDTQPFGDVLAERRGEAAQLIAGEWPRLRVDGATMRELKAKVLAWSKKRGFRENGSFLETVVDGALVRIPLYEVSSGTAMFYATTIRRPVRLSLIVEPRSWMHALRARLGASQFVTDDDHFNRRWHVKATDADAARQLLNSRCRELLGATTDPCRTSYQNGAIEIRMGSTALCGLDILHGVDIAAAFACAEPASAAYR
jgi:hypothetical protein